MTNAQHTPGPWILETTLYKGNPSGLAVHPCHFYYKGKITEMDKANARLIAAAPDLLEACKVFIDEYCNGGMLDGTEIEKKMIAAIAKAEGE